MKALIWNQNGTIELTEKEYPKILDKRDAIVKVTLSSICTSDLHIIKGFVPRAIPGIVLGHEFVGEVVEVGSGIENLKPGDRVAANCETFCGECYFCKRGFINNCSNGGWKLGCTIDGCQAEYVRVPYADCGLTKLPDNVSYENALFVGDILSSGYWGAELCEIKPQDTVAIIGAGPVGLCAMLSARTMNARKIVAIDTDDYRLKLAQKQGLADVVINPNNTNAETVIKELTKNSTTYTAKELQSGAIASAKDEALENFKQYCRENNIPYNKNNLDMGPINRIPLPAVENGKIVAAETELLRPTTKPNGKVVILNPGHGGYSSRTGYFDPGSYSFIKKANGKYAPLLEYEKMKIYAESLADKLRAKGYAVVITSGHAQTISDQKSVSNLVESLEDGSKGGKKYKSDDIAFVSLHADSEPGQSGTGICYDSRFQEDSLLADTLQSNLNKDDWIKAGLSERNWNVPKKGLQVLHQSEQIPSVLVEVEYVNGSKCKNLDSYNFQSRFETKLIDGLNEYFSL